MKKMLMALIALLLFLIGFLNVSAQEVAKQETHIQIVKKNDQGEMETIRHEGEMSDAEIKNILKEYGVEGLEVQKIAFDEATGQHAGLLNQWIDMEADRRVEKRLGLGVLFDSEYSNNLIASGIMDNSPADEGGINKGDVFVSLEGQPTSSIEDVKEILADKKAGDIVTLEVLRYGKIEKKNIRLDSIEMNLRSER